MPKEEPQEKKREPETQRLKIDGDWETAVAKALKTPKPTGAKTS